MLILISEPNREMVSNQAPLYGSASNAKQTQNQPHPPTPIQSLLLQAWALAILFEGPDWLQIFGSQWAGETRDRLRKVLKNGSGILPVPLQVGLSENWDYHGLSVCTSPMAYHKFPPSKCKSNEFEGKSDKHHQSKW